MTGENQIDFTEIEVEGDIDQQVIEFTVRESVIEERSSEPGDVVKERFNESSTEWEELDTSYLDQEDDRYVFEATVEDNSIFATTIQTSEEDEEVEDESLTGQFVDSATSTRGLIGLAIIGLLALTFVFRERVKQLIPKRASGESLPGVEFK